MAPRFGILLLSCAALAYEVLLTRLFAIVQWSHFAAIAISLALLGFGAGGSLVALLRRWLQPRFEFAFMVSAIGFAVAAPASFVLAQHVPFNPLELAWDYRQLGWLSLQFLLLSLPFLAVGCAIGMALSFRSSEVGRLYAYDLAGAAMGAGLILLLLAMLAPVQALAVVSLLGVLAALVARREMALSRGWDAAVLALIGLATYPTFILLEAEPSPYKDLSQARQVLGAKVLLEHSGVEGVFSVVRNDSIPIRHAPGISLGAATPIPEQMALFLNGDSLGALTRLDGDPDSLIFTDYLVSALPYALVQNPRVLLLDGAGGLPLLQAIHHGAESIEVVERIPGRGKLLRQRLAAFSGNVYERAGVQEYIAFPRHVLDAGTGRLDLILLDRTLGGPPVAPGLDAAEADWVLTREAFERALALLGEGGFVAIAHWLSLPPKTSLRLFNTAREALAESGHADQRLVYLRGWKTGLLLLAKDPITGEQIDKVSRFARSRSFDIAFDPTPTRSRPVPTPIVTTGSSGRPIARACKPCSGRKVASLSQITHSISGPVRTTGHLHTVLCAGGIAPAAATGGPVRLFANRLGSGVVGRHAGAGHSPRRLADCGAAVLAFRPNEKRSLADVDLFCRHRCGVHGLRNRLPATTATLSRRAGLCPISYPCRFSVVRRSGQLPGRAPSTVCRWQGDCFVSRSHPCRCSAAMVARRRHLQPDSRSCVVAADVPRPVLARSLGCVARSAPAAGDVPPARCCSVALGLGHQWLCLCDWGSAGRVDDRGVRFCCHDDRCRRLLSCGFPGRR